MEKFRQNRKNKPKHIAGRVHNSRCPCKKVGGGRACDCGQWSNKPKKFPYWLKNGSVDGNCVSWFEKQVRIINKWRKKHFIGMVRRFKERGFP